METQKTKLTRRAFLNKSLATGGMLALPLCQSKRASASRAVNPLNEAIPSRAPARPSKPRKLLIFELNVGYGGHRSIPTASKAFTLMGKKTGAFETVISKDPSVFEPENLKQFDAVFLNNTVGNLFTDPALRQSLIEFVYGGGGLMGVHGTTVAFTQWPGAREDWPEFGIMLGARGASHRDSDEHVIVKLDEPDHPINQVFGAAINFDVAIFCPGCQIPHVQPPGDSLFAGF